MNPYLRGQVIVVAPLSHTQRLSSLATVSPLRDSLETDSSAVVAYSSATQLRPPVGAVGNARHILEDKGERTQRGWM